MGAFLSFILGFMGSTALLLRGGVLGKISYAQMGYAHTHAFALSDFQTHLPLCFTRKPPQMVFRKVASYLRRSLEGTVRSCLPGTVYR